MKRSAKNIKLASVDDLFSLALGTMIILKDMQDGLRAMVLAYLISPFGIPLLSSWLIGKIGQINEGLKAI